MEKKQLALNLLSWTAVVSGALVGFGLNFLLNLLSLTLGLSAFVKKVNDSLVFSSSGFLAFLFVAILSMFATGWVAGRLTPFIHLSKRWGIIYGFISWSICFILTVILLTNMIQFGYFHSDFTSKNLVAIRITNDLPMLAETQSINANLSTRTISINSLLTFLFFLSGALASCVGGYIGFSPQINKKRKM